MNCLIILLLLSCGGFRNGWGRGNTCCQRDRDRDDDCPCGGEGRGSVRCPGDSDEHDHHDHDRRQGGPTAWSEGREGRRNNYPSISSDETCGCDAE